MIQEFLIAVAQKIWDKKKAIAIVGTSIIAAASFWLKEDVKSVICSAPELQIQPAVKK